MTTLARAYSLQGDTRAYELFEEARALAEPTNEPMRVVRPVLLPLIEYHWLNDQPERAREVLQACARWRIESAWDQGEIVAWHRRLNLPFTYPPLASIAAPFAAELDDRCEEAAALWQRVGSPINEALALLTATTPTDAGLNLAIEIAESAGAEALAKRARSIARGRGVRGVKRGVYAAAKKNALGLTARELQMLQLLVDGQSNKEIAHKLSRSLRTVEHHISALYAKLGAKNRVEASRIWSEYLAKHTR